MKKKNRNKYQKNQKRKKMETVNIKKMLRKIFTVMLHINIKIVNIKKPLYKNQKKKQNYSNR